jgi:hypothetical protein
MNTPCGDPEIHDAHLNDEMEWCPGISEADVMESSLLADLAIAANANIQARPCQMCEALGEMSDPVRGAVKSALGGTIGRDKLVTILTNHGYAVGRRSIERHRQEGHS